MSWTRIPCRSAWPNAPTRWGGWQDRRIVSTDRNFVNTDVTLYVAGTRTPSHFIDLTETGLAGVQGDLARWQMQNECQQLQATLALPPNGVMATLEPHGLFDALDRTWRLVGVTRVQEGLRRTVELDAQLWQGFFERVTATTSAPRPTTERGADANARTGADANARSHSPARTHARSRCQRIA